jgi:NAD(P)H-dependent flavin oxidoreductase YrpB (nitropropane dioxygenase family)
MSLNALKIGKYTIEYPIVQGGMGLGISWDKLAGTVSLEGVEGVDKNARKIDLAEEVAKVRNRLLEIDMWDEEQHAENSRKIAEAVDVVVNKIQNKG